MLDDLYKDLIKSGFPEDKAEIFRQAAIRYIKAKNDEYDREYEKLFRELLIHPELNEYQTELIAGILSRDFLSRYMKE